MNLPERIERALIVVTPETAKPDQPFKSTLLRRARTLARNTGCSLELFHVCYDSGIENQLLMSEDDRDELRRKMTERDATILAEMAARMAEEHIEVKCDVRWDYPRSQAILRKIEDSKPDVVLKHMRDHTFILGIASNTDWDLARKASSHIWLVNDDQQDINRIIAAVGNRSGDTVDITTGTDHGIVSAAKSIADIFSADIYPVNAYQSPSSQAWLGTPDGVSMPIVPLNIDDAQVSELEKKHESAIRALAELFRIEPDNVHIAQGRPDKVIPHVADKVAANLIVLGARNIGRFEKIVSNVTVEPVMSRVNCDIVITRDSEQQQAASERVRPLRGKPRYDLEQAISDPESVFESPAAVANLTEVSTRLRERILQAWEYDIRAQMNEENEGGPVQDIEVDALADIREARKNLQEERRRSDSEAPRLSAGSR